MIAQTRSMDNNLVGFSGNSVTTAGRCTQGICCAEAHVSEPTIVRGNAERDLLGPVFRPVAAKINFQIHEFSQEQVGFARFSQAFDAPLR